jgi:acyl-CoA synthetase
MDDSDGSSLDRWHRRQVPVELVERYVERGWWTADSLGDLVARGLDELVETPFTVHSAVRPFRGTIGDVDRAARAFAGTLRDRGIGPGDVVLFQLPNWVEAAITFWGAAYAGAIVVPVVHFYGAKELGYILRVSEPALVITADRFGSADYLTSYADLLGDLGVPWSVVGTTAAADLPAGATPFDQLLTAVPVVDPVRVDSDAPAVIAFTSARSADLPRSLGPPSAISWECSARSCAHWSGTIRSISSTSGTLPRYCV